MKVRVKAKVMMRVKIKYKFMLPKMLRRGKKMIRLIFRVKLILSLPSTLLTPICSLRTSYAIELINKTPI